MNCNNPECVAVYQALHSLRPWHLEGDPKDDASPDGFQRVEAMLDSREIVTAYLGQSVDFHGWQWLMDTPKWHKTKHGHSKCKRVNVIAWRYFPETQEKAK
jgi:hypothetical protein